MLSDGCHHARQRLHFILSHMFTHMPFPQTSLSLFFELNHSSPIPAWLAKAIHLAYEFIYFVNLATFLSTQSGERVKPVLCPIVLTIGNVSSLCSFQSHPWVVACHLFSDCIQMSNQPTYQAHPFSSFVSDSQESYICPICSSWAWHTVTRVGDVINVYSLLVLLRLASAQYWTLCLKIDYFWAFLTLWLGRSNRNQFMVVSSGLMVRDPFSTRAVHWVLYNSLLQMTWP